MKPEDGKQVLLDLLNQAGLKADALQLSDAWQVFKRFIKLPVIENGEPVFEAFSWECAAPLPEEDWLVGGALLRSMGTFDTREYVEELFCILEFEVDDGLRQFAEPEVIETIDAEEFIRQVEQSESFISLLKRQAISSGVSQAPL